MADSQQLVIPDSVTVIPDSVTVIPDSVTVIPGSVTVIPDSIRDPDPRGHWIADRVRNDKSMNMPRNPV